MEIYIPTLNRAQQITFGNLPKSIQQQVIFVSPTSILSASIPNNRTMIPPPHVKGIAQTRQYIADIARGPFVMLDDDLRFAIRRTDDPTKFVDATPHNVDSMFLEIEKLLRTYAHVGVSTREGGNRVTAPFNQNTRLLRILAYDARVLRQEHIRFDRMEVMEDFDVCLQLLRAGYQNCCINWIVHDQIGSNAAGGCSTYRDMAMQKRSAERLAELHPSFVTTVQKKTKTAWGGQERTDVRVQWKRAFEAYLLDPRTEGDLGEPASGAEQAME